MPVLSMEIMSSGSSTTQIISWSRFASRQISQRLSSETLKHFWQVFRFLISFKLSEKSFIFSASCLNKYKTSRSAILGPTEGREEKWSMSFLKDLGYIKKLKVQSLKLKVLVFALLTIIFYKNRGEATP